MFDKLIYKKLKQSIKKYFKAHPEVKTVAITGSTNKAMTKNAVATILDQRYKIGGSVREYHNKFGALLAVLGINYPRGFSKFQAWRMISKAAKIRIKQPATVEVIVQEMASGKPGDMKSYAELMPFNYTVLTSIAPERMSVFKNIENVAKEQLTSVNVAGYSLINRDDIEDKFSEFLTTAKFSTYGADSKAENYFLIESFNVETGYKGQVIGPDYKLPVQVKVYGEHALLPVTAAVKVARDMGLSEKEIQAGLKNIRPIAGRMNILAARKDSKIIDDSYNSSPASAAEALKFMYSIPSDQKIAVFGSMHHLGDQSADWHQKLGSLCNPNFLDWVVTVGEDANKYLAPEAKRQGCMVKTFDDSLTAGAFVNKMLSRDTIVLFKGSRDEIYLEEAIKLILHSTKQEELLVRQSPEWQKLKSEFFATKIGINEEIED